MCMTQLHRANGSKRLDDACKWALGGGATSQRHNKNNLEKVQDRGAERDLYGNLRGISNSN